MKKRILAMIMTLSMMCTLVPTVALAADDYDSTASVDVGTLSVDVGTTTNLLATWTGGSDNEEDVSYYYQLGSFDDSNTTFTPLWEGCSDYNEGERELLYYFANTFGDGNTTLTATTLRLYLTTQEDTIEDEYYSTYIQNTDWTTTAVDLTANYVVSGTEVTYGEAVAGTDSSDRETVSYTVSGLPENTSVFLMQEGKTTYVESFGDTDDDGTITYTDTYKDSAWDEGYGETGLDDYYVVAITTVENNDGSYSATYTRYDIEDKDDTDDDDSTTPIEITNVTASFADNDLTVSWDAISDIAAGDESTYYSKVILWTTVGGYDEAVCVMSGTYRETSKTPLYFRDDLLGTYTVSSIEVEIYDANPAETDNLTPVASGSVGTNFTIQFIDATTTSVALKYSETDANGNDVYTFDFGDTTVISGTWGTTENPLVENWSKEEATYTDWSFLDPEESYALVSEVVTESAITMSLYTLEVTYKDDTSTPSDPEDITGFTSSIEDGEITLQWDIPECATGTGEYYKVVFSYSTSEYTQEYESVPVSSVAYTEDGVITATPIMEHLFWGDTRVVEKVSIVLYDANGNIMAQTSESIDIDISLVDSETEITLAYDDTYTGTYDRYIFGETAADLSIASFGTTDNASHWWVSTYNGVSSVYDDDSYINEEDDTTWGYTVVTYATTGDATSGYDMTITYYPVTVTFAEDDDTTSTLPVPTNVQVEYGIDDYYATMPVLSWNCTDAMPDGDIGTTLEVWSTDDSYTLYRSSIEETVINSFLYWEDKGTVTFDEAKVAYTLLDSNYSVTETGTYAVAAIDLTAIYATGDAITFTEDGDNYVATGLEVKTNYLISTDITSTSALAGPLLTSDDDGTLTVPASYWTGATNPGVVEYVSATSGSAITTTLTKCAAAFDDGTTGDTDYADNENSIAENVVLTICTDKDDDAYGRPVIELTMKDGSDYPNYGEVYTMVTSYDGVNYYLQVSDWKAVAHYNAEYPDSVTYTNVLVYNDDNGEDYDDQELAMEIDLTIKQSSVDNVTITVAPDPDNANYYIFSGLNEDYAYFFEGRPGTYDTAGEFRTYVGTDGLTEGADYALYQFNTYYAEGDSGAIICEITEFKFTYEETPLETQTLTWDYSGTLNLEYGTASNYYTATSDGDGTISYASSDTSVVTVDSASGAITIVGGGSATITATATATATYGAATNSYTVVVAQKAPTVADFTISVPVGLTYGDTITAATVAANNDIVGMGAVTVYYDGETTLPTDAGTYTITFDVAEGTNYNAATGLTAGSLVVAAYTTVTDATVTAYQVTANSVIFPGVAITGVDGEEVTGAVVTYTIGTTNYETSDVIGLIEALSADESLVVSYQANAIYGNYAGASVSGTITVTMVDITFSATDGDYITVSDAPTYGDSWDDILTVNAITATVGEATGTGTYTLDVTGSPNAGDDQAYTLSYTGTIDGAEYTDIYVTSGTVNVAKKALTIAVSDDSVYNGYDLPTSITLTYDGLVTGDSFTATPEFTLSYTETDDEGNETEVTLADSSTNGSYIITWTNPSDFKNSNYAITYTYTATLTISTKSTSSSGGGGSSGSTDTTDTSSDSTVSTTDDGDATATVGTDTSTSNGTTTATVSEETLTQAIADVVDATDDGVATVEIVATVSSSADTVAVEVPANALATLAESDVETLTITSDVGILEISSEAAASIASQAGEDAVVVITVGAVDAESELTATQQAVVGDSPVFDLSVTVNGDYVTHFDGGLITVSVPYELADGQTGDGVVVWYLDDDGNLDIMFASYDEDTGLVTFTTTHFSYYVVAYNSLYATEHSFTDVDINAYYYLPMLWALENGITTGYEDDTFRPTASCTRAQAVTFLWRAMGEPEATIDNPFSDVAEGNYYYDAVLWAVENGITTGYEDGTFRPNSTCNRGAIVTFLYRLSGEGEVDGEAMSDVDADAYYYDAVLWAVENGITTGYADDTFRPTTTCNRGAIVTFLYRYLAE